MEPVLSRHSAPSARRLLKRARRTRVGVEPDGGVSATRDREGREALFERFLHLVRGLARRFRRGGELLEDLGQPAVLALIKAIDGFDPGRGTASSSFALPSIVGALKRHYRDVGCAVRRPRELQELALRASPASGELGASTASLPTAAGVAAHAHVSVADVLGARAAYASPGTARRARAAVIQRPSSWAGCAALALDEHQLREGDLLRRLLRQRGAGASARSDDALAGGPERASRESLRDASFGASGRC